MTDWKGMPSGSLTELLAKLEATPFVMKESIVQALCYVAVNLRRLAEALEEAKDG